MTTKYRVTFTASTEGNWCSQSAGRLYDSREAAQAALDADETARPDAYGNRCRPSIETVEVDTDAATLIADEIESVATDEAIAAYVVEANEEDGNPSLEQYREIVRQRLGGDYDASAWYDACEILCERYFVTDPQIRLLRKESGAAGDSEQVALCDRALVGSNLARFECARAIADARAQAE